MNNTHSNNIVVSLLVLAITGKSKNNGDSLGYAEMLPKGCFIKERGACNVRALSPSFLYARDVELTLC